MKLTQTLVIVVAVLVSACANPLNRVTSEDYAEQCTIAEAAGKLEQAEQLCYRALADADLGNLGPQLKSQRLYNLARIKRQLGKFTEAIGLLRESLGIEEKISKPTDVKIGRRLVELAVSLASQNKWLEGAPVLERVLAIADQFVGQERSNVAQTFVEFSKRLKTMNAAALAAQFDAKALALSSEIAP